MSKYLKIQILAKNHQSFLFFSPQPNVKGKLIKGSDKIVLLLLSCVLIVYYYHHHCLLSGLPQQKKKNSYLPLRLNVFLLPAFLDDHFLNRN